FNTSHRSPHFPSFPTRRSSDLQQVKLGFNPRQVLTTSVTPAEGRSGPEQVAIYYDQLAERLLAIKGIESVGFIDFLPLSGTDARSEEHTSELQSRFDLVCRLLL